MNNRPHARGWCRTSLLVGAALLVGPLAASAQTIGAAGAGGGFGGGFGGGGAGGGFGGSGGAAGTTFGGGGMAGTSFSGGGMAGGSFSGTSSSGISGLGFGGTTGGVQGGMQGGIQGATRTGAGYLGGTGTTAGPQQSNPFRSTYANPYALGYAGATGQVAFGQPLVGTTTTGLVGQTAPGLTGGAGAPGGIVFASSYGVRRAPAFTTTLGFPHRPPGPAQLQSTLQNVINRSALLSDARDNIRIAMAGRVAVLQGTVATSRERRLAEALVRLEPGVAGVQNQLIVPPRRTLP